MNPVPVFDYDQTNLCKEVYLNHHVSELPTLDVVLQVLWKVGKTLHHKPVEASNEGVELETRAS